MNESIDYKDYLAEVIGNAKVNNVSNVSIDTKGKKHCVSFDITDEVIFSAKDKANRQVIYQLGKGCAGLEEFFEEVRHSSDDSAPQLSEEYMAKMRTAYDLMKKMEKVFDL